MSEKRKVRLKHTLPLETDDEKFQLELDDINNSLAELERTKFSETEKDEIREKLESRRETLENKYLGEMTLAEFISQLIEEQWTCELLIEETRHSIYEKLRSLTECVDYLLAKEKERENVKVTS